MTRTFCHFHFKHVDIDNNCFLFLERSAQQLQGLTFEFCKMHVDLVLRPGRKLQNCNRLSELKVMGSDSFGLFGVLWMFSHLPELKILCIDGPLSRRKLDRLHQMTPPVTELGMVRFRETDRDFIKLFCKDLERFILNRRLSLQSLDLSALNSYDAFIERVFQKLKLKRLKLSSWSLSDDIIESLCDHQRGIVALELGDPTVHRGYVCQIDDDDVEEICTALPDLEELALFYCADVDESVARILLLKRLWRLDLSGCRGITAKSIINALDGLECSHLEVLNLSDTYIDLPIQSLLLSSLPNLREVTLSDGRFLDSKWVERLPRRLGYGMTFVHRPNT